MTGLVAAFGSGAMTNSIDDIATDAQAFFVIGSNTTENHPVIGMRIRQAVKQRGAKLIVADPRNIPLTDLATLHLRQRPGTDIALLNALANVLITEDLYDKEYIAARTEGFEALKAVVSKYTPEAVQDITGVPAADIREAARLMAAAKPAALLYAMGITQHTTGHQNVLACANLQLLLGNVGKSGGGVNPLRGQNNVQGACDMGCLPNSFPAYQAVTNASVQEGFLQAWGKTGPAKVGLTVTEMINAAERGQVRGLFVLGENPAMSDPDINHVRHALKQLEFLVTVDILNNETTEFADVILPGSAFAEKDGTFTNTERRVQRVRKALQAPGEAKPDWWIVAEIGARLQQRLGGAAEGSPWSGWQYASPNDILREINALTPSYAGITPDRVDEGLQWPCPNPQHAGTKILHREKFAIGNARLSAVEWLPPHEQTDEEYPYVLTTGRMLYHFHGGTMTRRSKRLDAIRPEGTVEINTLDARALQIKDGEIVKVSSRRGEVMAKAEVTDGLEKGVVFMTFHFKEAAANLLTINAIDPIAKIPEYKACAVKVERI